MIDEIDEKAMKLSRTLVCVSVSVPTALEGFVRNIDEGIFKNVMIGTKESHDLLQVIWS